MNQSTKIVKFMVHGLGDQELGWSQYGHIVKMHILVNKYILLYYRAGKYSPLLYFASFALVVNGRIQN